MKRNRFYLAFLPCLVCFLVGCAVSPSKGSSTLSSSEESVSSSSQENIESSSQEQPLTYKLTIIDPQDFIFDKKASEESYYAAGEEIQLHSHPIMDVDLAMYVDGEFSCIQTVVEKEEGYLWEYRFVMPSQDAVLEFCIQGGGPI